MARHEIFLPMNINPHTGHKEYTKAQLDDLKPKWTRQWKEYTDLSDEMISICVDKLHTGPFTIPGTRIAEGAGKGMSIRMKEVRHEWNRKGQLYTGSQVYREAKKRLNASAKRDAEMRGIPDPFAFEYFLPARMRKTRRSAYDIQ